MARAGLRQLNALRTAARQSPNWPNATNQRDRTEIPADPPTCVTAVFSGVFLMLFLLLMLASLATVLGLPHARRCLALRSLVSRSQSLQSLAGSVQGSEPMAATCNQGSLEKFGSKCRPPSWTQSRDTSWSLTKLLSNAPKTNGLSLFKAAGIAALIERTGALNCGALNFGAPNYGALNSGAWQHSDALSIAGGGGALPIV